MRLRFKTTLTFIFILIIACVTLGVGYIFYVKVISDAAVIIVDGNITINYLNGNEFVLKDNAELQFSVTNNSNEQAFYYIQLSDIQGNVEKITYEITSSTNEIKLSNPLKSEIVSNYISIAGNETDNYTISFKTENADVYSGKIVVGVKQDENTTFAELILANNPVNEVALTQMGTNATEDEGLIKTNDDLGITYYFRGNVQKNYVSFGGYTWRIVRINGDGSVKLVLNTLTDVLSKYYNEITSFNESVVNESLNTWYQNRLSQYADYIANYKFCNDTVYDDTANTYPAYSRILTNKIPTFVCLGQAKNSKIGLLTADEVILAGASTSENKSYYLYNEEITTDYFTMTSAKINTYYFPFIVKTNGALSDETNGTLIRGVRPVINIIRNVSATGTGTADDPYIIKTSEN
ncbi:MAG: hypothetical protein K2M17_04700 [Bacilli bacterium]|nr:hypothetical protein [Bacilli bacterium]